MRTKSSKAKRCPVCGAAMKRNGRTRAGTQRWMCVTCSPTGVMRQRDAERGRQLDAPRLAARPRLPVRVRRERRFEGPAQAHRVAPEHPARHPAVQGETPHGDGGRHVHEPRLVSGHSYRRRKRRDAGMQRCPNEPEAAYMALFSRIPAPDVLITNGLRGAESACREIWPSTRIRRCLVHVQRNTRTDLTYQTSFRRSHYSTF